MEEEAAPCRAARGAAVYAAVFLTLYSGWDYLRKASRYLPAREVGER